MSYVLKPFNTSLMPFFGIKFVLKLNYCIRIIVHMNQSGYSFIVFFLVQSMVWSQSTAVEYIDSFSDIAIEEMNRTGIPASIKLAQGLLESNIGKSPLSTEANNHFGLKCGNEWQGKEMYREDDDYGLNNVLTKSCFRVFDSGLESYRAHSDFIMNPVKEFRYGFLFSIPVSDYEAWAYGLQSAGYATDPEYAIKLISLIQRYRLDQYDGDSFNETFIAAKSIVKKTIQFFHLVQKGETLTSIAAQYNIDPTILQTNNAWSMAKPIQEGTELMWNAYLPSESELIENTSDNNHHDAAIYTTKTPD